jgi:hypothetical protein
MSRLQRWFCSMLALATPIARAQPCEPRWSHDFPSSSILGEEVRAFALFDDGNGPRIYAGGDFEYYSANGTGFHLGRWAGPLWEKLGGVSPSGPVSCMTVWDDPGNPDGPALYVGGQFHDIGTYPYNGPDSKDVRYIAKWDGKDWSYLDTGLNNYPAETFVNALAVYDDGSGPALFAAGRFSKTGDLSKDLLNIARWDGHHWQDVGGGLVRVGPDPFTIIWSLAVYDDGRGPALYAGGVFNAAGGAPISGLARWNGKAWSAVEPLLKAVPECPDCFPVVRAMAAFDDGTGPALYVAGDLQAPGVPAKWTARLRHGAWEPAGALFGHRGGGGPPVARFYTMAVMDAGSGPALYIGGRFMTYDTPPGADTGGCLARWDPAAQSWIDLDANPAVKAVGAYDDPNTPEGPRLWAGGNFGRAGGGPNGGIATLGPDGWQRPGPTGLFSQPSHIAAYDDGNGPAVYLGGSFETIGDLGWAYGIARWTKDGWENVGDWADIKGADRAQVGSASESMSVIDLGDGPMLYAPASLSKGNAKAFTGVVRWDGSHWSAVGQDMDISPQRVFAYDHGAGRTLHLLTYSNSDIYSLENGLWTLWADGEGYNNGGAIAVAVEFDDGSGPTLWVCGTFFEIEGVPANFIARYRPGSGWEPVGVGMDGVVMSLAVWDDPGVPGGPALYASGSFTKAGGKVVNSVARWDGKTWHSLAGGLKGGYEGVASAGITAWDDGSGSALYASGLFTSAGGKPIKYLAKWDGTAWTALKEDGVGISSIVTGVACIDLGEGPSLFATGTFLYAGGYPSPGFAAWIPCPPAPCPADLDGSGTLDLFDFLTFINLYNASDPAADCNADGSLTPADFTCYSALFNAGC